MAAVRFESREHPELPALAWLAEVRADRILLHHGPAVEVWEDGFFEGAWDGPFPERGFLQSGACMGSGGRLVEGRLEVITPCHPLEGLWSLAAEGVLWISPSLACLLARSGRRLDSSCLSFAERVNRPLQGERHRVGALPLLGGGAVTTYRMRRLRVEDPGRVSVHPAFASPRFQGYEEYLEFLVGSLRALAGNAGHPERRRRYEPLTTVSSGYDSAACAALGREIGCREAVTIREGRPLRAGDRPEDLLDSGRRVGEALGLVVREREREAYRLRPGCGEAEFVAAGDLGQDLVLSAFEADVAGRLVLTGFHGDVVWSRRVPHRPRRELVRGDPSGASLGEFRLRTGFLHVPVPCLGASAMPDILAISRSASMKAWSLGTTYDRPIPRRLTEEAGVPRDLFGQKKQAVTVLLDESTVERLGAESGADFREYRSRHAGARRGGRARLQRWTCRWHRSWSKACAPLNKVLKRLPLGIRIGSPVPRRWREDPGEPSWLMHWGLEHLRARYRCLEGDPKGPGRPG